LTNIFDDIFDDYNGLSNKIEEFKNTISILLRLRLRIAKNK